MICSECGQRLPGNAASCSACGRRVAPERIEPVLDALRLQPPPPLHLERPPQAPPRRRTEDAGSRGPSTEPRAYAARLSQALGAWPHAPHVVVALGCVLAIAIYFSSAHDHAVAAKAGAARIAAAIGARTTTSQPAPAGAAQFSAKQALQALYGNYDPVLDGAFWTVTDAPKRWAAWNGRAVLIRPLVSRSDETQTRHVLVTNTVEIRNGMVVKQGAGCRTCKSLIGGALFERQGEEWKLVSDQRFLGVEGAFGAPPHIAVAFPAKGGVELRIEPSSLAASEVEPASPVVIDAGRKAKGVLTQPRQRPSEPPSDSPFPTAAASH